MSNVDYRIFSDTAQVVGRLKSCYSFWSSLGASQFILDVIREGYKLSFSAVPASAFLPNNKSSLDNSYFVVEAIKDLVSSGAVVETSERPYVVNPLTVAQNVSKLRLVLDLRHINQFIVLEHMRFEDWSLASKLLKRDSFIFSFDLKSGYHHIDIHKDYQKFLGFSWLIDGVVHFYYFTVLPFGLASAGWIFSKVVRCLVTAWRRLGISIIVYLDDGLGICSSFQEAQRVSDLVRKDIIRSGFVISAKKSCWEPTQTLVWLGVEIRTDLGLIRMPFIY